jgi:hypothetical protein
VIPKNKKSRICIIGAGPGGLSVGYFLQKAGYTHVTILEKLSEVGGLCNSMTFENRSFDLGANYLTPAYKKTLAIAKEVDAKLYTETKATCYDPATNQYSSILQAVTKGGSFWQFSIQAIRYFIERQKVSKHLPPAGFEGVSQHPELTCTFDDWLVDKKLTALRKLFEIPITLMGYGKLDEIPAPYALTYMTTPTFWNMLVFGAGLPTRWPKRFIYGFQRFWQKVSWNLTVIKSAQITQIVRDADLIKIQYNTIDHDMNDVEWVPKKAEFDYLIVATPLTLSILEDLFTDKTTSTSQGIQNLTKDEQHLFGKVTTNPYCMITFILEDLRDRGLKRRLINVLPVQKIGTPYVITQQFEGNPLVSFYSRAIDKNHPTQEQIIQEARDLYHKLGSKETGDFYTYDRWTYFPHVSALAIKEGFYDQLEEMQGKNNTFFVGGLMAFELIEPIINYSDHFVKKHFSS